MQRSGRRLALPGAAGGGLRRRHRGARAGRPALGAVRRRAEPLPAPVHVRLRGVPRRPSRDRDHLPGHRVPGGRVLPRRGEAGLDLAVDQLHPGRRRRDRSGQVRRQLRREPGADDRGDRPRLRPGRLPRRGGAPLGRGARRDEPLLRVQGRAAASRPSSARSSRASPASSLLTLARSTAWTSRSGGSPSRSGAAAWSPATSPRSSPAARRPSSRRSACSAGRAARSGPTPPRPGPSRAGCAQSLLDIQYGRAEDVARLDAPPGLSFSPGPTPGPAVHSPDGGTSRVVADAGGLVRDEGEVDHGQHDGDGGARPPAGGPLTVADLEAFPDDGHRYELLDGVLVVTPAPSSGHQRGRPAPAMIARRATCRPARELLVAPFAVHPEPRTAARRQQRPSCSPTCSSPTRRLHRRRICSGAPLLAVEVLSPNTQLFDRNLKKAAYERMGAAHFWLVDPRVPELLAYALDAAGAYQLVGSRRRRRPRPARAAVPRPDPAR